MSEEYGTVRITVIDVKGSNQLLVDSIRAATAGNFGDVGEVRISTQQNSRIVAPPPIEVSNVAPVGQLPSGDDAKIRVEPKEKRKSVVKRKTDSTQMSLRAQRKEKLAELVQAKTFADHDRYSAAIGKDGATPLELAALITRLTQESFGFDEGLSPFEVRTILKNRFYINIGDRTMEETMKKAPSTFFAVGPADFDQRAKLYRPMKDCLKRVDELLAEFNEIVVEPTRVIAKSASS